MSWNYRVMKQTFENGEVLYGIHEVYYDGNGAINGWTADSVEPVGETQEEFIQDFSMYRQALRKPVLDESELEKNMPLLTPENLSVDVIKEKNVAFYRQERERRHYQDMVHRLSELTEEDLMWPDVVAVTDHRADHMKLLRYGMGVALRAVKNIIGEQE